MLTGAPSALTSATIFGTAYSFSWPFFLAAIPLGVAGLVYIYRKRGLVRDSAVVSSIFLIRSLPTYLPSRRRFVPPLAFWLQLLLLLLLSLAASGLVGRVAGQRIAVLIDNSKGMGARLSGGESRLESTIRIASADLRTHAASNDLFSVYTVASAIKPVVIKDSSDKPGGIDSSQAISALKGITPAYAGDRLITALSTLVNSHDSVWLYTDRVIDGQPAASSRLKITTVPTDPDLARNVWISKLTVRGAGDSASAQKNGWFIDLALSRIGGGGAAAAGDECQIEALCFAQGVKPLEVERLSLSLNLKERVHSVSLGPLKSDWSYCRVQLNGLKSDLLDSDNFGWVVRPEIAPRIGVVSDTPLEVLGVDKLSLNGGVVAVDLKSAGADQLRGVIYHRSAPLAGSGALDIKPTLIVYPALNLKSNFATVRSEEMGSQITGNSAAAGVEISRWDESHPVLRYARPALLELAKARVLECTDGAKAIISSTAGPIACAAERDGKRHLILGFELFPFDGAKNPTVSIITLNAVNWLFGDDSGDAGAGVNFNIGSQGDFRLPQRYGGDRFQVSYLASEEEAKVNITSDEAIVNTPGVVSFKGRSEAANGSLDSIAEEGLMAFNSIIPEESDLLAGGGVNLPYELLRSVELLDEAKERGADKSAAGIDSADEGIRYDGVLAALALVALFFTVLVRLRE